MTETKRRLRTIREEAGLAPTELAGRARVSIAFLYKAEAGQEPVSRTLVARICNVLNVKIDDVEGLNLR